MYLGTQTYQFEHASFFDFPVLTGPSHLAPHPLQPFKFYFLSHQWPGSVSLFCAGPLIMAQQILHMCHTRSWPGCYSKITSPMIWGSLLLTRSGKISLKGIGGMVFPRCTCEAEAQKEQQQSKFLNTFYGVFRLACSAACTIAVWGLKCTNVNGTKSQHYVVKKKWSKNIFFSVS